MGIIVWNRKMSEAWLEKEEHSPKSIFDECRSSQPPSKPVRVENRTRIAPAPIGVFVYGLFSELIPAVLVPRELGAHCR